MHADKPRTKRKKGLDQFTTAYIPRMYSVVEKEKEKEKKKKKGRKKCAKGLLKI